MPQIVTEHQFANLKSIRVEYHTNEELEELQLPKEDKLALVFENIEKTSRFHIRPDEALIIIRILSEAVYQAVEGYAMSNDKIKENDVRNTDYSSNSD